MGKVKSHYQEQINNWDNDTLWEEYCAEVEGRRRDNMLADILIFLLICLCLILGSTWI